jgi:hypothetical protein
LVSVDGRYPQGGIYGVNEPQQPGQRFTIAVTTDPAHDVTKRYSVRCLPTDFPEWSVHTASYGLTPYFWVSPVSPTTTYAAIYDRNGVPLWWSAPEATIYSAMLPNGDVAAMVGNGVEERKLDGTLVRTVSTVGGPADFHDVLLLPNGHVVMVTIQPRTGVDLTALGGPADASVCDHVIEEIDPTDGSLVWSWDTYDHIPPREMDPTWFATYVDAGPTLGCGYDVYHWNSIEPTPTGYLLSYRHLDAVYDIDQASGDVLWKLSGSSRPESLTIVGDPDLGPGGEFGGQHDARMLADGTVTVYDDGTGQGRLSRAARYRIDPDARTATFLESTGDAEFPTSFCCGSARYEGSDVWLVGWGGTDSMTEMVGTVPEFSLRFPGLLIYRALPLSTSQVSVTQLDAAMDAKFANPAAASQGTSDVTSPFPP